MTTKIHSLWGVALLLCTVPAICEAQWPVPPQPHFPGHAFRVSSAGRSGPGRDYTPVAPGAEVELAQIDGPAYVSRIALFVETTDPHFGRDLVLRAWWDGEGEPSIEAPIGDFFGVGDGVGIECDSAPSRVSSGGRAFECRFFLPFQQHALITLRNDSDHTVSMLSFHVDGRRMEERFPEPLATFHASFRIESGTRRDSFPLLEAEGAGQYVGTVLSVVCGEPGWFGEGAEILVVDGDREGALRGTSLDETFGSGFGLHASSSSHCGVPRAEGIFPGATTTAYRWSDVDSVPFTQSLNVSFERLGWSARGGEPALRTDRVDTYCAVAFWYQVEPHRAFPPLPSARERRGFEEQRFEMEEWCAEAKVPSGAPTPTAVSGPSWSFGAELRAMPATAEEAQIAFDLDVAPGPEQRALVLRFTRGPRGGAWQIEWDGVVARQAFDAFAPEAALAEIVVPVAAAPGVHRLVLRSRGRAPASLGYDLDLDCAALRW